ncbi:MAG TPA: hypothetical protein VK736_01090, partial [Candidatus Binatia bacterium]|nr:hypothetical protein [Candidatus Binatia bacterium]
MWWRSEPSIRSTVASLGAGCAAAALLAGCQITDGFSQDSGSATATASTACDIDGAAPDSYRIK